MDNTHLFESYIFLNKMNIELDVLGASIMNRIHRHVNCTDVVAIDNSGIMYWLIKLLE